MALVKAQMSFYHDSVGTRAKDEMFDVQNEQTVSQLEQAGYVQRVEGEQLQAYEQAKALEEQVGQRNALTNEAVSMATHEHNQQAAQHQQQFAGMRQQAGQAAVEQEISRLESEGNMQKAEQLRSALKSQQSQQQQNQQQQQQSEQSRNARINAEQAAIEQMGADQAKPTNTQQAEAEQAAANVANTQSSNAQTNNARAKKADR
jgi:hypothetical protein